MKLNYLGPCLALRTYTGSQYSKLSCLAGCVQDFNTVNMTSALLGFCLTTVRCTCNLKTVVNIKQSCASLSLIYEYPNMRTIRYVCTAQHPKVRTIRYVCTAQHPKVKLLLLCYIFFGGGGKTRANGAYVLWCTVHIGYELRARELEMIQFILNLQEQK